MLKTSDRVRPCSARCSPRLVGRFTISCESSRSKLRSRETVWRSSPFGPFTVTRPSPIWTSTLPGISIGSFPMRLIAARSPHEGDDFAAHAFTLGLVGGQPAARVGHDHAAHPALHLRRLARGRVLPAAGLGDAPEPADHGVA